MIYNWHALDEKLEQGLNADIQIAETEFCSSLPIGPLKVQW